MAVTVEMVKETGRLEGPAIRAYDKLLTGWKVDGKVMYPSDYGGAYLSDDYKLVVNYAGEGIQTKLDVAQTLGESDVVRLRKVKRSRLDLIELSKKVTESGIPNLLSVGRSYEKNNVRVRVSEKSDEVSALISTIDAGDALEIEVGQKCSQQYSCEPGQVLPSFSGSWDGMSGILTPGTIGWQGRFTFGTVSQRCFITTGHTLVMMYSNDESLKLDDQLILTTAMMKSTNYCFNSLEYTDSVGQVHGDFAIVETGGGMTQSHSVLTDNGSILISAVSPYGYFNYYEPLENLTIFKGKGISGATTGKVVEPDRAGWYESKNYAGETVLVSQMVVVDPSDSYEYFSQVGDSGCPVYYNDGSKNVLLGIVTAGATGVGLVNAMSDIIAFAYDISGKTFTPYLG